MVSGLNTCKKSVTILTKGYFLDKMSSKILDLSGIEAKVYNTNYSGYLVEREKEFQKQLVDYTISIRI
mgnify:CR=1 FL=1